MGGSLIYRSLGLYRLSMNLLYRGRYARRAEAVCRLLRPEDRVVLELCFGDVLVAQHCRATGRSWIGLDVSAPFVAHAVRKGFDARLQDVSSADELPACDACVMMGSLYHFEGRVEELFRRIKRASRRLVLSEPVVNWTQARGVRGWLARRLTRVGEREERFRFDARSLVLRLEALKACVGFSYRIVGVGRDMVVEVVWSS